MSIATGPNTVKDGLVLSLDAASGRSFKGEPTVNLAANGSLTGMSNIGLTYINDEDGWKKYSMSGTFTGGTYPYIMYVQSVSFVGGVAYTTRCTIKTNAMSKFNYFGTSTGMNYVNQPMTFGGVAVSIANADGSYTVGRTGFIYTNSTSQVGYILSNPINNTTFNPLTDFVWIKNLQVEQKPYPTPFVNGTRGTTVATGGGWADMSGNENHGQLINGPKFDTAENGSLLLDGINDYILIDNPTAFAGPYTILLWLKPDIALVPGGSGPNKPTGTNRKVPLVGPGPIWNPGIWITSDYIRSHAKTQYVDSAINWTTTTWDMIGMTYDGTNVKNILGGKILADTHITSYSPSNPSTLHIGSETNAGNAFNWNGRIGSLKIYNRVLLPHEIQQNFNATRSRFGI